LSGRTAIEPGAAVRFGTFDEWRIARLSSNIGENLDCVIVIECTVQE
jgi:hypothetical protein